MKILYILNDIAHFTRGKPIFYVLGLIRPRNPSQTFHTRSEYSTFDTFVLFINYINDIKNTSDLFKFICYADDTALSSTIQYLNENGNGINNTFKIIINNELSNLVNGEKLINYYLTLKKINSPTSKENKDS